MAPNNNKRKRFVVEDKTLTMEQVHYLPFKVEYEGRAAVTSLFTNQSTLHPDLPNVSCNHFRGRPLQGTKLELPSDYVAFVLGEEDSSSSKINNGGSSKFQKEQEDLESDDVVQIGQRFQDMTYWEWDKPPSSMDSSAKLQDWLKLATVIHEPIQIKN